MPWLGVAITFGKNPMWLGPCEWFCLLIS
jgi:hypothetical protein